MRVLSTYLETWATAGVALAAAVLAGALLLAAAPTFAYYAIFGLLLVAIAGCLAARLRLFVHRSGNTEHRLRLLESAVIHTHDAVVILDAEAAQPGLGRSVLYANDAFYEMTGYSPEEVIGRSLHYLRGPGSDPITLDQIREALAAGKPLRVELLNYRKDGVPFWVDLSLVPVPDPVGGAAHWVMIQRNITDRKRAETALQRSEGLFRGIFENTSAGVTLTDRAGQFVSCNPAFAAMTGRTVEELLTLSPEEITHPDDWAAQVPLMAEIRAGMRDRFHLSKRYVLPNGELVWVELSYVVVKGPSGLFEYGLDVSMNVDERRRLEDQLRQAQKMEVIGQMAGGVAHDFNNLLTAVLGNLALVNLPENDPNRTLLASVEQAAVRAADLTGKLLGYARRNQLVFAPINPADAFDEVVGLLHRTLDPRVQLVVEVAENCVPVQADPTLLNQALMNLCLNSRDAMPEGGTLALTAGTVEITAESASRYPGDSRPGRFVCLTVADTGEGMTDEVKARIFEPFFTTKGQGKGTGLGLPMVQGIVKQHQGWVTCVSEPGVGTRLDLYLPPADPNAIPRPIVRSPQPTPIIAPILDVSRTPLPRPVSYVATAEPIDCNGSKESDLKATILLVDDESMIRGLGQVVLDRAGFHVLTADDGVEAVEVFSKEHDRIDLVILDVTMPRMSGRDAFGHLLEIDPSARILFSTGYSDEHIAELEGAVGLLSKPYRPHELLTAVQSALDIPATAG
jgi:two-component system cell cycle sensor histidine kinase/response regulator CckA